MYISHPLQGQHGFTSLEFDNFTAARLEVSVHSQLLGYKYVPREKPNGFSIGFFQDKTAPERSTNFEEFTAGVIKDKPANIDTFYDANVKTLFDSVLSLRDYCQSLVLLSEDETDQEITSQAKV